MNLSIVGTSNIVKEHIKAAKKNGFQLLDICTTNPKSKNLKKIFKKNKFKNFFYSYKEMVNYHNKNNIKCVYLVAPRIKDTYEISLYLLKEKKIILAEKPLSLDHKKIKKLKKYYNQIFVGYNRVFYNSVNYLKKIKIKNSYICIECIENDQKTFVSNSCHILSILIFLFGKLKIKNKIFDKTFVKATLIDKNNNIINFVVLFNANKNFKIEINSKKKQYLIKPIENLMIYTKLKKQIKDNQNFYFENTKTILDDNKIDKYKPGFLSMWKQFKKFIFHNESNVNISFASDVIKIANSIIKK